MKIFYLPDLGEGLVEAEIREWYVKAGETVKVDQLLVSVETAKAVVDVPSPQTGKIIKLYGKSGDIIKTHAPLVEYEEDISFKDKGTVVGNLDESDAILIEKDILVVTEKSFPTVKAMPAVRALAKQLNVNLEQIVPTGTQGQITAEDVKKAAEKTVEVQPVEALRGVRRQMAIVMATAHREVVPVTLMEEADISAFSAEEDITVRILKAMIVAARHVPALNAWFDGKTLERSLHKHIHIGLAVDTDEGLWVPVIKQADQKDEATLRAAIDTFKRTVKDRSISPNDLQGATLTLSNFGIFTGRYANPVVVPPQVAILGCGHAREEPRVYQGRIEPRRLLPLSLTFDHRAVTGGEASRFLDTLIQCLEDKNL